MTDPEIIEFFTPGHAVAQGSKRHIGRGHMIESSKELAPWRADVKHFASTAMNGRELLANAINLRLIFVLPRPLSTPKRRTPYAVKRPDVDKLARAVLDAITGVVIRDDSQVVTLTASKRLADIGEPIGLYAQVRPLEPENDRA